MEVNVITDESYPDCEISSLFCRNKYIRVVDIKETGDKKHFTELVPSFHRRKILFEKSNITIEP